MLRVSALSAALVAVLSLSASPGYGVLLAIEDFEDYEVGSALENAAGFGRSGGAGWTSPWDVSDGNRNEVMVVNGGLSYSGGEVNNNGGSRALQFAYQDGGIEVLMNRAIPNQTGDVYMSVLMQSTADGTQEDFIQFGLDDNGDNPNLSVAQRVNGAINDHDFHARSGTSDNAFAGIGTNPNQTYMLVMQAQKTAPGNYNLVNAWIDPTTAFPVGPHAVSAVDSGIDNIAQFSSRFAFLEPGDTYLIDRIAIGTTYEDVVNPGVVPPIAAESFLVGNPPNPSLGEYAASPTNDGRVSPPGGGTPQNPDVPGFTGAWQNNTSGTSLLQVVETGLDHPSQDGEAGGAMRFQFDSEVGDRTVSRDLASPPQVSDGSTFYMSGLLRLNENDPDFDGYALGGFTENDDVNDGDSEGWRIGFAGDGQEMDLVYRSRTRLAPPNGPVTMEDNVILDGAEEGETYLVVIKGEANIADGGGQPNDVITIWLNPTSTGSEAALGAPALQLTDFSLFGSPFNEMIFSGSDITGAGVLFDEFRLGTALSQVVPAQAGVPEPTTALLGLCGLAALVRRRRRTA